MNRGKRIFVVAALVLAGATGLACGGGNSPADDQGKPVTVGSATGTPEQSKAAAKVPAAKDFKITLKTIEKQCFGSGAGCVITYRVGTVTVPTGLDASTTYEVSYKVTGATEPAESTVTISGGKFDAGLVSDQVAQTKNKDAKLIATATAVEAV